MKDEHWSGYIWDRSTIKLALVLVSLLVFGIFTSVSAYYFHLNTLKRIELENRAGQILGAKVSIGDLYWHPEEHMMALVDIKIDNPPGFDVHHAMTIMSIRARIDSVSPSSIVFSHVTVVHTLVYLTFGSRTSNLMNMHAHMSPALTVAGADGKPFTVIINELQTKDGLAVQPDVVPADRILSPVDMEPLHLKDIGEKEKGAPVAQALALVVDQIIRQAFLTVAREGDLEPMLPEAVQDIKTKLNMDPDFIDLARRGIVLKVGNRKKNHRLDHLPH